MPIPAGLGTGGSTSFSLHPDCSPSCSHLTLLLSQPLKHVGIEPLFPCELLADPLLADNQLGLGGFVAGVELQNFLEVCPCQVKVIHRQVGLSPAEKALLIVAVQFQGLRTQEGRHPETTACSSPGQDWAQQDEVQWSGWLHSKKNESWTLNAKGEGLARNLI